MPDILTHVLVGYVLATALSLRYRWITPGLVTVVMVGAMIPDLTKIKLLVPSLQVEGLLGIPFEWWALHRLGGTLVVVAIGAVLASRSQRKRVFALLLLGALSHLFLDALLLKATGHSFAVFWPLSTYNPPSPGLYLSSDRWPALVAGVAASVVWYLRYRRE